MENLNSFLDSLPVEKFKNLIKDRYTNINNADSKLPSYDYNANIIARALHPSVQYVVVDKITEQPDAKTYTLKANKSKGTNELAYFNAGQYISVSLQIGSSKLTRAYSLCSSPEESCNGYYMITIKHTPNGFASNYILDSWKVGTELEISAPDGDFGYERLRDAKNIVAIAGGSGITPFYSIAKSITEKTNDCNLTILYGCRTEKDIWFHNEFQELCNKSNKIKVVYILSDEQNSKYEHGFINADIIKKYSPKEDYSIFVCGPKALYNFISKETPKLDLPKRRVRFDVSGEYHNADKDDNFPKDAVGKTFKLKLIFGDGKTKTVEAKSSESILVAIERAGISSKSKCRSGECGFCRSKLKSGSFYIPNGMEYRKLADKKDGFIHPCCSFPTSDICMYIDCQTSELKRKDIKTRQKTVSVIMTSIMSVTMGIIAAILAYSQMKNASNIPFVALLIRNILMSITVGLIGVMIFPFSKWGQGLARKNNAKPGSLKFTLLNCLPLSLGNCVVISIVVSFVSIAIVHSQIPAQVAPPLFLMWISSWIKMFPITFVASYIIACVCSPIVAKKVGMSFGPKPSK